MATTLRDVIAQNIADGEAALAKLKDELAALEAAGESSLDREIAEFQGWIKRVASHAFSRGEFKDGNAGYPAIDSFDETIHVGRTPTPPASQVN